MIDVEQFNRIEDVINEAVQGLRERIIEIMAQRIMAVKYDTLIESNRLLVYKLQSSGMLLNDVIKEIAKQTGKSENVVRKIFEDSYVQSVKYDNEIYKRYGVEPLTYAISPRMMQILNEAMYQTNGELRNMTKTLADSTQRKYITLLDSAYMKVRSGAFTYSQSISDIVSEAIKDGAYIYYPSGHKDRIEVAARRAVLCGVNQSSIRAAVERCRDRGWNHICVSSHLGARTYQEGKPAYADHSAWQGKIYWLDNPDAQYESFVEVCGWGHGDGIGGWGCRHSAFAWRPGMGNPFEQFDPKENRERYELVSKQRAKERRIRDAKVELTGLHKAIELADNSELRQQLQDKYDRKALQLRKYNNDYKEFCDKNELKPYLERLKTAEWSAKESKQAVLAANKEIKNIQYSDKSFVKRIYVSGDNNIFSEKMPHEKVKVAVELVSKYTDRKSMWNGKVNIDDTMRANGKFSTKGDITVKMSSDNRTYIHEALHSASVPYIKGNNREKTRFIEEASVELLARNICEENNIPYSYVEKKNVNALLRINEIMEIEETDDSFAKLVYNINPNNRLTWLSGKVKRFAAKNSEVASELKNLIKELGG